MKIKRGWATDYGKVRYDVEVDETDLLRMLAEAGAQDPEAVRLGMPTKDVMLALDAEAQAFMHYSLSKQEPAQAEEVHLPKLRAFRAERDALLARYVTGKPAEPDE